MAKNIKIRTTQPFYYQDELYDGGKIMWVDLELYEKLKKQNLAKILEIKKEVHKK